MPQNCGTSRVASAGPILFGLALLPFAVSSTYAGGGARPAARSGIQKIALHPKLMPAGRPGSPTLGLGGTGGNRLGDAASDVVELKYAFGLWWPLDRRAHLQRAAANKGVTGIDGVPVGGVGIPKWLETEKLRIEVVRPGGDPSPYRSDEEKEAYRNRMESSGLFVSMRYRPFLGKTRRMNIVRPEPSGAGLSMVIFRLGEDALTQETDQDITPAKAAQIAGILEKAREGASLTDKQGTVVDTLIDYFRTLPQSQSKEGAEAPRNVLLEIRHPSTLGLAWAATDKGAGGIYEGQVGWESDRFSGGRDGTIQKVREPSDPPIRAGASEGPSSASPGPVDAERPYAMGSMIVIPAEGEDAAPRPLDFRLRPPSLRRNPLEFLERSSVYIKDVNLQARTILLEDDSFLQLELRILRREIYFVTRTRRWRGQAVDWTEASRAKWEEIRGLRELVECALHRSGHLRPSQSASAERLLQKLILVPGAD